MKCACCGKPAAKATTTVWNPWSLTEYRAKWRYEGPGTVTSRVRAPAGYLYSVNVWHGEYWLDYDPFCTLRCARAFADAAYRGGYRIAPTADDPTPDRVRKPRLPKR